MLKNYTNFKKKYSVKNSSITKLKVNSNASHNSFIVRNELPMINVFKYKSLFFNKKSSMGKSKNGILCRTKGRILFKKKYPIINKHFRNLSLLLVSGFFYIPFMSKNLSSVISSSGEVFYINNTYSHKVLKVFMVNSIFNINSFSKNHTYIKPSLNILQLSNLIMQLPKYKNISSLEIYPGKGVQYVLSSGSKSLMTKIDLKTNLSLIKLPSGVHKVFSVYSTGSIGQVQLTEKKLKSRSNAGFFKKIGKKSLSRGVAKNPVDHPHGGRNKAIKYQRTP